jgi:hypothetical protein
MYWEYAGTRYKQKFKALEAAGKNYSQISAHFINSSFDTFDWSTEPASSLENLMTERCFQIRDKYDYIKLYFSGGSDSTTMLNRFLKHKIHIDEIVTYRMSPVDDFNCKSNFEINDFVIPYLNNLQNHLPKTKFKLLDIGSDYFSSLLSEKFFFTKNTLDLREIYLPKIKGNNFCHLIGSADPFLEYHDGIWYEVIYDSNNLNEYRYRNIELFYTSEDLPELHSKQCHILKNVYKKLNITQEDVSDKQLIKDYLRDTPVAPTPEFLNKKITSYKLPSKIAPKNRVMLVNSSQEFRQKYFSVLSTSISGRRVADLYDGIEITRLNLGR